MKRLRQLLCLLVLVLLLAVDVPYANAATTVTSDRNGKVDTRLINLNNRFAFRLYHLLLPKEGGGNIFISPASIELALGMTYNGAVGTTKTAMANALGLQGMTDQEFNQANGMLMAMLQHPNTGITLASANAMWGQQNLVFNPDFLQLNTTNYQAEVRNLDFLKPEAAANTINQWASNKTQGLIPTLVNSDNIRNAALVLTNALYFKGLWTTPFDPAQTKNGSFTLTDGTHETLPMMHHTSSWDYLETKQFQAISLPYGKDKLIRLDILLPKPGVTLAACAASITPENWTQWMTQWESRSVALSLPRFNVNYGSSLKNTLTSLGMGMAFGPDANFTAMFPARNTHAARIEYGHDVRIGDVIHKTALKVDEAGTTAAAATAVVMCFTGMPQTPISFTVAHPFLIAIRDQPTGTLLFWGSIAKP